MSNVENLEDGLVYHNRHCAACAEQYGPSTTMQQKMMEMGDGCKLNISACLLACNLYNFGVFDQYTDEQIGKALRVLKDDILTIKAHRGTHGTA